MSNQESAFIISRLWPPESESLEGPMWPRWWRPLKKWESKGASNSWRPPCMAELVVRRRRRVRKSKVDPYHARIWRLLWELLLLLLLRSWFWGRITRMLSSFSQYLVQVRRGHLTLCFAKSERERERKGLSKGRWKARPTACCTISSRPGHHLWRWTDARWIVSFILKIFKGFLHTSYSI